MACSKPATTTAWCAIFSSPPPTFRDSIRKASCFGNNVETVIWQRHLETGGNPAKQAFLRVQADRMFRYEQEVCRACNHVVAVSETDALRMKEMFGIPAVSFLCDLYWRLHRIAYFQPPKTLPPDNRLWYL